MMIARSDADAMRILERDMLELRRREQANRLAMYYRDEDFTDHNGIIFPARSKYPRHMDFFRRGADVFARMFQGANGVGKTELALYEICCHLRGWYPEWWEGVRFNRPVDWWSCGQTSQTVRDIQQTKLLGKPYNEGTGILPADWLDKDSITRSGVPGAIDTFRVKRAAGGFSYLGFKSYNQGVAPFFGPEKDGIHLDEPPPLDIYSECVVRTRNRPNARIMVTASPKGTNMGTIRLFKETEDKSRILIKCGWAHVPHLTEQWKADTRANTAPYLLPATEHGEEGRGAGAVYALLESEFVIEPIKIPAHWRWMWAMDGGYHNTAAGWFAWDPDQDVMYLVSEYKDGGDGTNVGFHAARFIARNKALKFPEMPGVADAAAINQSDGKSMISQYRDYGLKLKLPKKAVILGVDKVRNRLQEGRLKVFSTCEQWLDEFRNYSYEIPENEMEPKIVKVNDHCLHPDTLVITRNGKAAIRDLVGTDGEVLSIGGYRKYRNCRMTAADQEIVEVLLSDGSSVKCTPDHRFMTARGWVEARDLLGEICENTIPHSVQKENAWLPSYPKQSKITQGKDIISAESTSSGIQKETRLSGFTLLFGLMQTVWPLRRAITSTIKMKIAQTISRIIWNFYSVVSTCLTTTKASVRSSLRWLSAGPLNGMGRLPALNGIGSTSRNMGTFCAGRPISHAFSAAPGSQLRLPDRTNSVPTSARQLGVETPGSMTSLQYAHAAEFSSLKTNMRNTSHVGASAAVSCVGVRAAGRSDVYCLTVPDTEAFAIENGVIVHNCMDFTRYAVMDVETTAEQIKRPNNPFKAVNYG